VVHPDAVTLKQLRVLAAIVDCGGIAAAAEKLHVTAPAVSTQLRTLEANIGTEVLERPGFAPNAVGRELLEAARRIETTLSSALARVAALEAGWTGRVVLGVTSTGKYFAPGLIARIIREMPDVDIHLEIGNRSHVIAGLAEGRLDIAITGRPPREPMVEATVLGDHPHVWIASPDHPMASERRIVPARLLGETILIREIGSGTRILMERLLMQAGDGLPYRTLEFGSNESIKQAVMAGLGIAFISAHTIATELESERLATLDVAGTPVVRKWFILHLADTPPRGAVRRVLDFVIGLDGVFLPRSGRINS